MAVRAVLAGLAALLLLPATAAAHGLSTAVAGKGAFTGEQRLLVVPVTWGPEPFSVEQIRQVVFDETDRWLQEASFGATVLNGDVAPWQHVFAGPVDCDTREIRRIGLEAAARAGFDPARYNRFAYLYPRNVCPFAGMASAEHVWLNGVLTRKLVAHELGHTYGLGHANTWECSADSCTSVEYGDPYDTMGSGTGHFNAFEKFSIGWLRSVSRVAAAGSYAIERLDRPTGNPQALVIQTARSEYWVDVRLEQLRRPFGPDFLPTGVLVRAGPNPLAAPEDLVYADSNLLLPDPVGAGRPAVFPGETFREEGSFDLTVESQDDVQAVLRFAWTDTTPPRPPRIVDPGRTVPAGRLVEAAWDDAVERGSGVAAYEASLDGRAPARFEVVLGISPVARYRGLQAGPHVLRVVAIDRAGNRSAAAVRRFEVVKPKPKPKPKPRPKR